VAQDDINYRRFFDINDLAALRQENAAVFDQTHTLILDLVKSGAVDALRVEVPCWFNPGDSECLREVIDKDLRHDIPVIRWTRQYRIETSA